MFEGEGGAWIFAQMEGAASGSLWEDLGGLGLDGERVMRWIECKGAGGSCNWSEIGRDWRAEGCCEYGRLMKI